ASRGGKGINFHGGLGKQIAGGLGDKLPGAKTDEDRETARYGTFYSPFAGAVGEGFWARPLLYGMLLCEQFAGTTMVANEFDAAGANAKAYAAKAKDGWRIAILNKDAARDLAVHVSLDGVKAKSAKLWRLIGPSLDATKGITLAGAEIAKGTSDW